MIQPNTCALSELSSRALEDEIATLAAHIAAAEYRFLCLVAELDRRQVWAAHGLRSAAHWLAWRCGVGLNAGREKVRVAQALGNVPMISEAFAEGRLSFSKVRALTRIAAPHNEAWLLALALNGTAVHVEKVVRLARRHGEQEAIDLAQRAEQRRRVAWRWDTDGSLIIEGRLPAELGMLVVKALEAATTPPSKTPPAPENVTAVTSPPGETLVQRRADALVAVAESFLATGYREGLAGERNQVQVIVQVGEASACGCDTHPAPHIDGGPTIADATARRLACDSSLVVMTEDSAGNVLDVGRRTRTIPPAIVRALRRRDGGCRFPGCTCKRFVDGHHVIHWADGGETKLANLVLLCHHHHRLVHEGGFTVASDGAGGWQFTRPDGTTLPRFFTAQPVAPGQLVASQNGMGLSPLSLRPRWRGEKMDDNMAVAALQTLARRARLAA